MLAYIPHTIPTPCIARYGIISGPTVKVSSIAAASRPYARLDREDAGNGDCVRIAGMRRNRYSNPDSPSRAQDAAVGETGLQKITL